MIRIKKSLKFRERVAFILAMILVMETVSPTVALALTSGPTSPEFSSFEPVATTNMVNEFSGDFTYNLPVLNIPGASGGGYALSLSYHSGESVESESSWVGNGWTLNPGSINRSKRGFADDSKNNVTYHNMVPPNWTATAGLSVGNLEIYSINVPVSLNASIRYNNYKGFGYAAGAGVSVKGMATLGYNINDGNSSFSAQINPGAILSAAKTKQKKEKLEEAIKSGKFKDQASKDEAVKKLDAKMKSEMKDFDKALKGFGGMSASYGLQAFGEMNMPTHVTSYIGTSINMSTSVDLDPTVLEIGGKFGASGSFSQQTNIPVTNITGYGYMYAHKAGDYDMMDYYSEKEGNYNKRDRYLPVPFSNADLFTVTGEGLSGGFRLYNKQAGHFKPNKMYSGTLIAQTSLEGHVGQDFGLGFSVGAGLQVLEVSGNGWGNDILNPLSGNIGDYQFSGGGDEPYFFRFNGDLGGDVDYDAGNRLTTARVHVLNSTIGLKSCDPQIDSNTGDSLISFTEGINRSGRSSYIDYHTNDDMGVVSNTKKVNAIENSPEINNIVDRTLAKDGIGEIVTYNDEGNRFVYGLPVYSKNEVSLQYDLRGAAPGSVINNYLAYKNTTVNFSKVGQESNSPYATSFLLTQINTPDYIDRTLNGPTDDDFGGYTKFEYTKRFGYSTGNPSWYKWRMPYAGLFYTPGAMSDPSDDMGSFSSGEKEVCYLSKIVTKTHIAYFRTSARADGLSASSSDVLAAQNPAEKGNQSVAKLDSISLYTNNNGNPGKLVKKVCFKYNYSVCKNILNTLVPNSGKLTLSKVWFEYEGIVNARISPYEFVYEYPAVNTFPAPYTGFGTDVNFSSLQQNPDYSPYITDAWGNYRKDTIGAGESRFERMRAHVDQTPSPNFDPAAWQLKRIKLPSGGEIQVQYEQDRYLYVQDRRALALVSINATSDGTGETISGTSDRGFYLNTTKDLGITTAADVTALRDLINQQYNDKKIYFKFLYALIPGQSPDIRGCTSEYVTGYADFKRAGIGADKDGDGLADIYIVFDNTAAGAINTPCDVCRDFVKKERSGKLNETGNCDASAGIPYSANALDILMQLKNKIGASFIPGITCMTINPDVSYLRIPVLRQKLGGGLRVKRLLMYDPNGLDNGQPALYGTEYTYETEDGQCSGVASNEPSTIREENALVNFLPKRNDQSIINKAISGTDKEQFEGPMGESILPSPSVGYSRVIAKNIHNGKTNTGYIVSEFYTAKDYPFDGYYPALNCKGVEHTVIDDRTLEKDWINIPAGIINLSVSNVWTAQGYKFILNEMSGQPKSVSTYIGTFNSSTSKSSLVAKMTSTEYSYFQPGETIPMLNNKTGAIFQATPGKEMETVFETKSIQDVTQDCSIDFDVALGSAPPIFVPNFSGAPTINYSEQKLRTHVTCKTIRFPAIQKSITTLQDGIYHKTENIAYNQYTGKPVRTVTTDGFDKLNLGSTTNHDGTYTSYMIPASWEYKGMGQKAVNQKMMFSSSSDLTMSMINATTVQLTSTTAGNVASCALLAALSPGDLLSLNTSAVPGSPTYYVHVDRVEANTIIVQMSGNLTASVPGFPVSLNSITVLRSGRTNQLNTMAGGYTTYGAPATASSYYINQTAYNAAVAMAANINIALSNLLSNPSAESNATIASGFQVIGNNGGCGTPTKIILTLNAGIINIRVVTGGLECTGTVGPNVLNSTFVVDPEDGKMYYQLGNGCSRKSVPCLTPCATSGAARVIPNVVVASAQTFNHYWPYDASNYTTSTTLPTVPYNEYETGVKGKWRSWASFAYKEGIRSATKVDASTNPTPRTYDNAGTFNMTMFNWKNLLLNDTLEKWIKASWVTKYSPFGDALEEQDALGIYSTAKFGYNSVLPTLVANNAPYSSVQFESFEKTYGSSNQYLEENLLMANTAAIDNTKAHAGKASFKITSSDLFTLKPCTLTTQIQAKGLSLKVWVKDANYAVTPLQMNLLNSGNTLVSSNNFTKIAQTGEWTLFEAIASNFTGFTVGQVMNLTVSKASLSAAIVWVDDVRLQPLDTKMISYVYDTRTLRLLASFDDQHFGMYYQYNDEGKLVRKMVETERGLKTIQEKQYNTPKVAR